MDISIVERLYTVAEGLQKDDFSSSSGSKTAVP
ncbi:hypothetical protein P3T42_006535 [Paraburkholderia sp. GAS38]